MFGLGNPDFNPGLVSPPGLFKQNSEGYCDGGLKFDSLPVHTISAESVFSVLFVFCSHSLYTVLTGMSLPFVI